MNNVNSSKNRIFLLTGFMASGKSYLGKKAADLFGINFVDADAYIEQNENNSIPKIFEEKGEEYFRSIETKYFCNLIEAADNKRIIIASGGGFPLKEKNQSMMKKCISIFINTDFKVILARLNADEKENRPLLKKSDTNIIKKLYEERLNVYKSTADYIVNNENEFMTLINTLLKAAENE